MGISSGDDEIMNSLCIEIHQRQKNNCTCSTPCAKLAIGAE